MASVAAKLSSNRPEEFDVRVGVKQTFAFGVVFNGEKSKLKSTHDCFCLLLLVLFRVVVMVYGGVLFCVYIPKKFTLKF